MRLHRRSRIPAAHTYGAGLSLGWLGLEALNVTYQAGLSLGLLGREALNLDEKSTVDYALGSRYSWNSRCSASYPELA
jgi:hypothetical protein